jgi:hypothetical protein
VVLGDTSILAPIRVRRGRIRLHNGLPGLLRRQRLGLLTIALAAAMGACATPTGYQLQIRNVDGPPVTVWIEGHRVGLLRCGDPPIVVRVAPNLAPPPWDVGVFMETGESFGQERVGQGGFSQQELLIRDIGLIAVPPTDPAAAGFAPVRPECQQRAESLGSWVVLMRSAA